MSTKTVAHSDLESTKIVTEVFENIIGHFTYKSSPKCDKITYVPISGFFPVTKKMKPGFSFTRDFSIQF